MSKALSEISHYNEYDYVIVNDDFDGGEAVFQEIRKMMEALPVLVFNSEVQEYEALGDRSYTYKIEKYDDLQNSET